ncbi:DNA-binding transcriptional regulator, FrmR family [Lampropedia hyalina DSM 16112]|jgi:DNA-binding FrmR family transcriptional regulator|uniref:DNA-binding transcriptional regulator, FrmR family n=1 Tax=Lampropedia hyalina DSM 16112 TaxID=1122156 RepID=A0A1M4T8F2_9BURK|nr:metal/formaldehyde-sensitive transcriptional repressor [Lampropedia hyalina]SHE40715.1 DNA-binding transcriptional regulator, FrmR family [Lampropedia hyalina DSM 16112]
MPHSPEEKKRVVTRLRRIKGQTEALERAVEAGTDCGELLQQLAALRGATNGLMAEVLESHLRETFLRQDCPSGPADTVQAAPAATDATATATATEIDTLVRLIRRYLT